MNEISLSDPGTETGIKVAFPLFLSALIAAGVWVYYLSQGFHQPGLLDAFTDIQAYALQKGHIAITPDYRDMFYHDVSLYQGNYYLYWGMLPSALHAFLSAFFGRMLSSYFLVLLFLFLFVYFLQRIVFEILSAASRRPSSQEFLICATIILSWMLIFNLPLPYGIYRDSWFFGHFVIYEQQILFGMGLALPGLFYLIEGQKENRPAYLIIASCFFAAAASIRGTWFVFAVLVIPVILGKFVMGRKTRSSLKPFHYTLMALPVLLIAGQLALNFVRFGSIFDFGLKLQNPVFYPYLRIQNGLFSPMTQLANTAYKLLAYYTSPGLTFFYGLEEKISSWSECVPPFLLYNNPLWLILLPIALFGIYRALRMHSTMRRIAIILGVTSLVINALIVITGNIVTMRYFVECYYLTMLFMLAGLSALLPVKVSFPILVLLLVLHLPSNIKAFLETSPELRLVTIEEHKPDLVNYRSITPARAPFLYKNVHWPEGVVAASSRETFTHYNTLGMIPLQNGLIGAKDVSVVYVKPQKLDGFSRNRELIEFIGVRSTGPAGRIRAYVEKKKVAEFSINPKEAQTYKAEIESEHPYDGPRRILIYFFEENESYLPAKQRSGPAFAFEMIRLSHR
ncbi:MAG: hypothetical protein EG826_08510 [Deltaproteobacteria bacterium]|nr:hypothetical protein [Deltaproteobacteria bacterium]